MLKKLINKIFVNQKDDIILLLENYELDTFLSTISLKIDKLKTSDLKGKKNIVGTMTSTFLTRLNSVVEKIDSIEEKEKIEYILSEISSQLIYELIQKGGASKSDVLTEIRNSLITTCEVNNWNTELLLRKTKIDILHTLSVKEPTTADGISKVVSQDVFYYEWLNDKRLLDEISYILKDRKTIKSTVDFLKLFNHHKGNICVKINPRDINLIVILFDQLKINRFIKPKGTKGHFIPLKKYCMDLDKNVLFKKDPKRIKELLKRKDEEYQNLISQVEVLIGINDQKIID